MRFRPDGQTSGAVVTLFGCSIAAYDSITVSTLGPLLPQYVDRLDLRPAASGLLVGSFAIGLFVGALAAARCSARFGIGGVIRLALVLHVFGMLGFGFGGSFVVLTAARSCSGVASSLAWTAVLAWFAHTSPQSERSRSIGLMFAAASVGLMIGPALGALAASAGTAVVFTALAVVAVGLLVSVPLGPHTRRPAETNSRVWVLFTSEGGKLALAFQLLSGFCTGILAVAIPHRIHEIGGGPTVIGAVFLSAHALSSAISPASGRLSRRLGALGAVCLFGVVSSAAAVATPLSTHLLATSATTAIAVGTSSLLVVPATAFLSAVTERARVPQASGFASMNLAWAPGATTGAIAGGALLGLGGAVLAFSTVGVVSFFVAGLAARARNIPLQTDHHAASSSNTDRA